MMQKNKPIGVFDSGVGGLTVTAEIIKQLPNESLVYLGDTARVPYGTRSRQVVTKFALELVDFLLHKDVKALVIACNTISANALEAIRVASPVPVVDVISPTLEAAFKLSKNVGVIGTASTINSGAYARCAWQQACPLLVPLAEEGLVNHPAVSLIARGYLSGLQNSQIDTLILGCTHFPILLSSIAKTTGPRIKLVTSGPPTAKKLAKVLAENDLLASSSKPSYKFFFTDSTERVKKIGQLFFGKPLPGKIVKINL